MTQKTPLKLVEDHDQTYFFWKKLGLSGKPLIHLDAHIDFNFHPAKPLQQTFNEAKSKKDLMFQLSMNLMYKQMNIKEKALTNIGNYIYPAMRDGIVSDFYWVIPGGRDEFKKSFKSLRNILKTFFPRDPFEAKKITRENGSVKAKVYGRDFIITTLEDLPADIADPLLDIDTDYITTDTIMKADPHMDTGKRFPWIWPDELVSALQKKRLKPSCVTIAYSVNGGFTPLIYKFLGDEVALFLNGAGEKLKKIIFEKNKTLSSLKNAKVKNASGRLEEILEVVDTLNLESSLKNKLKAHIAFILFRCFTEANKRARAGFYYNTAVTSDRTYRVKDNNYGPLHLRRRGNMKSAEREFNAVLSADRTNAHALTGLADVFVRRKNLKKAKALFKKALAVDKKNQAALLGISSIELRTKNYKAVLKYLKNFRSKDRMQVAPVYSLLARAYAGLGMNKDALVNYKLAHRFGVDLGLYISLFKLLIKIGVPDEHKGWVKSRIDTYEAYKKRILKNRGRNKKPLKKADARAVKRTNDTLRRADKLLKRVKKICG